MNTGERLLGFSALVPRIFSPPPTHLPAGINVEPSMDIAVGNCGEKKQKKPPM